VRWAICGNVRQSIHPSTNRGFRSGMGIGKWEWGLRDMGPGPRDMGSGGTHMSDTKVALCLEILGT
jgi:hypothetical protein